MFIYFIVLSWLTSIHRSNRLLNCLMCWSNQCDILNRTGAANEVITFTFTAFIIKYFSIDKLCLQQHMCWINEALIEITILKSWDIIYLMCRSMQQYAGYLIRPCVSDSFWVSVFKKAYLSVYLIVYQEGTYTIKLFSFPPDQAVSVFSYVMMACSCIPGLTICTKAWQIS